MCLKFIYHVKEYALLGNEIWKALCQDDISQIVKLYSIAIARIPYEYEGELHTSKGRTDLVLFVILEFKFAKNSSIALS